MVIEADEPIGAAVVVAGGEKCKPKSKCSSRHEDAIAIEVGCVVESDLSKETKLMKKSRIELVTK